MSVKTFKEGDEFCVYDVGSEGQRSGSSKGCHGTRAEANTQARAINTSMNETVDFIMGDGVLITEQEAHEDTAAKVRDAFRRMVDGTLRFSEMSFWDRPSIVKTFDDFVVVEMEGKLFKVEYTRDDEDNFEFANQEDWELGDFEFVPRQTDTEEAALFTQATVNALPDESFATVLKNGDNTQRFFPYRNSRGLVHVPQLLESLREVPTKGDLSPRILAEAMTTLGQEASSLGIFVPSNDHYPGQPAFQIFAETHDSESRPLEDGSLDFKLIEPGWGNIRDHNYYPKEMLRRDAHKFEGIQMHEVQHDDKMRTTRTWVATVTEAGKRFTESGAPICRAFIHDSTFLDRCKNLEEGGLLTKLQNSIVARGVTSKGKIGNKQGNIVQEITAPKYVDFVTQAGAGGHALALYSEAIASDLALITISLLKESRPDLVYHLQMGARNSVLKEVSSRLLKSETEGTSSNKSVSTSIEEVNMPGQIATNDGQVELQEQITALQGEKEVLESEVQDSRRASALALIVEKMPYKDLRPRFEEEVKSLEVLSDSYLEELGVRLDTDRQFWADRLGEGSVSGLGKSESESAPHKGLPKEELEERWVEHDAVYGPSS